MEPLITFAPPVVFVAAAVWEILSGRRRARQVEATQAGLAVGDGIVTVGGIIGRLTSVTGPVALMQISDGAVIRIDRRSVSARTGDVPALRGGVAVPARAAGSDNPGQD